MTEMNQRIRGRLGIVTDAPGKAARQGEEGIKPEDQNPKNLEELDDAQLVVELDDAAARLKDAAEAVGAITAELSARTETGEEGAEAKPEEAPRA